MIAAATMAVAMLGLSEPTGAVIEPALNRYR